MRLKTWILATLLVFGICALQGLVLGHVLAAISSDYLVRPGDLADLGLRLGCLSGTIVGATTVLGRHPAALFADLRRAIFLFAALSTTIPLLAGLAGALVPNPPQRFPELQGLAHPTRYIVYICIYYGWLAGLAIATIAAGIVIRYQRTADARNNPA